MGINNIININIININISIRRAINHASSRSSRMVGFNRYHHRCWNQHMGDLANLQLKQH
jgi:hypothetical protein